MRRLLRILLNVATVGSLLLAMACVVFVARSVGRREGCIYHGPITRHDLGWHDYALFYSGDGAIHLLVEELSMEQGVSGLTFGADQDRSPAELANWLWIFEFERNTNVLPLETGPVRYYRLWIQTPYWPVILLFSVLPTARLIRWQRRRRAKTAGHCPTCNYDLRATPNRCPECGAIPLSQNN